MNCFLKRGRTLFSIFQSSWLVEQRFFLRPPRSPRPCRSTLTKASSFGRHQHRCSLAAPSRSMLPPLGFQRVSERLTRENGTKRREAQAINRLGNEQKKRKSCWCKCSLCFVESFACPGTGKPSQLVCCAPHAAPEVVKGWIICSVQGIVRKINSMQCLPFFCVSGRSLPNPSKNSILANKKTRPPRQAVFSFKKFLQ